MFTYIHIRSHRFPLLAEKKDAEFFGKALADYLQAKLTERGYEAPFIILEDWGWWVELNGAPFAFGVCIMACKTTRAIGSNTPSRTAPVDGVNGAGGIFGSSIHSPSPRSCTRNYGHFRGR
jgi:hypothetical protein